MIGFPKDMRVDADDMENVAPEGIRLTAQDTGAEGVHVAIAIGECFGERIEWYEESEATVIVTVDEETGGPALHYKPKGQDLLLEKRGLDPDGVTWWRYPEEAMPDAYREHCLRIVRLI